MKEIVSAVLFFAIDYTTLTAQHHDKDAKKFFIVCVGGYIAKSNRY